MNTTFETVDEYIASQSLHNQVLLSELREIIKSAAPDALEIISYQMPAYKQDGMLVYFAGYAKHIGFYPGSAGVTSFFEETKNYKTSKGTIQFPIDKPLPKDLIEKIVKFRIEENRKKAEEKKNKLKNKKD